MKLINAGTTALTTNFQNDNNPHYIIDLVEDAYSRNFISIPSYFRADSENHFTSREIKRNKVSGISNLHITQRGKRFVETETTTGNVAAI